MYSLDFEEFLWAKGYNDDAIAYLKDFYISNKEVPKELNDKYLELFREFMIVGGMPEVVQTFIDTNNFQEASKIQGKILADYQDDISKHAKGQEKIKVRQCYDSIPKQLDESKEWYSIKRWAKEHNMNWRCINWRRMKALSYGLGYEIKKIFDANYGQVNIYHINVFKTYFQ